MLRGGAATGGRSLVRRPSASVLPGFLSALLLTVSGCAAAHPFVAPALPAQDGVYVSIGDSYAAGDQPAARGGLAPTRNGFAYEVTHRLNAPGRPLRLMNFACTGATSSSVLSTQGCPAGQGCPDGGQGLDGPPYPSVTQAEAALSALRAYQDQVRLVTISIGGNDVDACTEPTIDARPARALGDDDTRACIDRSLAT